MLTRLYVDGFKNLSNLDIRFGPFTCIAGENAVGKSNIFDVIELLVLLTDHPVAKAVGMLRGQSAKVVQGNLLESIFHQAGDVKSRRITILAELIIPRSGRDELGQMAEATFNFLKYELVLESSPYRKEGEEPFTIVRESLKPIRKGDAHKHLLFKHSFKWRQSVIQGRRSVDFISTTEEDGETYINLHQDGGSKGKPNPFLARNLPRTILSTAKYASENPTALLVRREMQSWKLLQLEPTALRQPDELETYNNNIRLGSNGAHLAATVYRMARQEALESAVDKETLSREVLKDLSHALSELIDNVKDIEIDRDEKRQLLSLRLLTRDGSRLSANSLSDGTLRFLALAVLEMDYTETGLLCMEEPENGIHPRRVPAIMNLLRNIPFDPDQEHDKENSLRQVIINTHAPLVVQLVPDDCLIYLQLSPKKAQGKRFDVVAQKAVQKTWRTERGDQKVEPAHKGKLLDYLKPDNEEFDVYNLEEESGRKKKKLLKNRHDLRPTLPGLFEDDGDER